MSGKNYDELESLEAPHIERDYVCAVCWGTLITQRADIKERLFKVVCPNCGEDKGFVTRTYVERRRAENGMEAVEAKHNLGKALGIKEKPLNLEKTIKKMWN